MKTLFNKNYHPQLIEMMAKSVYVGALSLNILTPILLSYLLFEYIPSSYIYTWIGLNLIFFILRVVLNKKALRASKREDKSVDNILFFISLTIFMSAILHAYALWYSSFHVPDIELFFMAIITTAMVSASISTLGSLYHIFAIFVVSSLLAIIFVFLYHGGEMFYTFAFAISVYMYAMLKNGYKHYLSLEENIILKESFQSRVKEATLELEQQNRKLNESLNNFQDLLESSMVMIAFQDERGIMMDMNKSALRKFGYKNLSEIVGKHMSNFLPERSMPIVREALKQEASEPYELILKKKDGTEFPSLISAKYIILDGQRVRMTTMMDLTDLKEQENLLQHQSKLAQMGEMMSMIAHQWRQPLLAIGATSSGLNVKAKLGKADKEVIEKMTDEISTYVQHLSQTIDDFRDFFKPNKDAQSTNYCKLIKSVLSIIEKSIQSRGIELILELECEEEFHCFSNELKQVVLNLIKNAEDVLVERKILNPYIKISTYKVQDNNLKFILEISDNGGGMPLDILDRIFDPYFSTKLEKNGSGLGLYMSKTIIEDHCHGKLEVENIAEGALFRIKLGASI